MSRTTYHHGDLRRSAIAAAVELVRSGGTSALAVREVARELEVSPAAIYRHFPDREALVGEVARAARRALAGRMLVEMESVGDHDPRIRSIERFVAVGRGYLGFAEDEPNLLAVAFLPFELPDGHDEQPNPWQVVADALDELVAVGAMPVARRPGAEIIAWSAVHGFALLREARSFSVSGDPQPPAEALLDAVARSLDLSANVDAASKGVGRTP